MRRGPGVSQGRPEPPALASQGQSQPQRSGRCQPHGHQEWRDQHRAGPARAKCVEGQEHDGEDSRQPAHFRLELKQLHRPDQAGGEGRGPQFDRGEDDDADREGDRPRLQGRLEIRTGAKGRPSQGRAAAQRAKEEPCSSIKNAASSRNEARNEDLGSSGGASGGLVRGLLTTLSSQVETSR